MSNYKRWNRPNQPKTADYVWLIGESSNRRTREPKAPGQALSNGSRPGRTPDHKQRWMTFRNHAKAIEACDFFVDVTATFRVLYFFVVREVGTRRIVHRNVTTHPTAEWTLQQFREALPGDHTYRFAIHDRVRIYSKDLDQAVEAMGGGGYGRRCAPRKEIHTASGLCARPGESAWTS